MIKRRIANEMIKETTYVLPNVSDHGHSDKVRLATIHRVKGLGFDEIILAGIAVELRQADTEERALLPAA